MKFNCYLMRDAHMFKIFLVISSKSDAKSNTGTISVQYNLLVSSTNTNNFGQMFFLKLKTINAQFSKYIQEKSLQNYYG
jgi:hypothetical protein